MFLISLLLKFALISQKNDNYSEKESRVKFQHVCLLIHLASNETFLARQNYILEIMSRTFSKTILALCFTLFILFFLKKALTPYHFLNMFLTFRHLKPYVLIWFVLIKKRVFERKI